MKYSLKRFAGAAALATITAGLFVTSSTLLAAEGASAIEQGKKIAFDRKKGNCLTCHQIEGGTLPGNIAPPLVVMKARFPDKAKLRAQIWDPTAANPNSIMPPFGKHGVLTEEEVDLVTEFVHSL
jgi:sulfur-oxidizing protein SoxX